MKISKLKILFGLLVFLTGHLFANKALFDAVPDGIPERSYGEGHYDQLIIRGAYLIDGTGAPATGPVDIVVEKDRIVKVVNVGTPGIPINSINRPQLANKGNTREIDAHGKYLLPGFIDSHSHIHSPNKNQKVSADYIFKLWLGHGVTSVREVFGSEGESRLLA